MVKRSGTYTKDISTLSKDAEKENVPKPVVKTVRRPSNAGSNLNEKRTLARQQSKGKQEDGTQLKKEKSVLRKRANNYVRRGQKDQRSDRFARHAYAFLDRVFWLKMLAAIRCLCMNFTFFIDIIFKILS